METILLRIQIRFIDRSVYESTIPECEIESHLKKYEGEDFDWKIVNRWIVKK